MKIIPYGRQNINEKDIRNVIEVLKSDWMTQGPKIDEFEKALASYCGAKYAVAVSSGTAALHIACLAAGLKEGDEAVTTPITFLATPNSVVYAGARPVFADIDYGTVNIDPEEIKRRITKKTRAILPVHFAGRPCDMPSISKIASKAKAVVIEDACHALGAEYKHKDKWIKIGSCRHSDMTVFSFHPVKHITTGEGGAVTTNDKKLYEKLKALRSHGIYKTPASVKNKGPWYYEMRDLGFNYRITDFQCALGIAQLGRVKDFVKRRRHIAEIYNKAFGDIEGVEVPEINVSERHTYHLYVLKIDFKRFKTTRKKFVNDLKKKGILTQVHYIPVYRQPFYRSRFNGSSGSMRMADGYYKRAVSIPMYPSMKDADAKRVVNAVRGLLI